MVVEKTTIVYSLYGEVTPIIIYEELSSKLSLLSLSLSLYSVIFTAAIQLESSEATKATIIGIKSLFWDYPQPDIFNVVPFIFRDGYRN